MKRTTCCACGYDDLELILDLGYSPVADAYTLVKDELTDTYPLQLAVCTGCWLVQLLEVVDHTVLFGTGYSFYSSASAPLSEYHQLYAEDVLHDHRDLAKKLTVEVGCNDGDMLRHFHRDGCHTVGVDPASGPAEIARRRGLEVIERPFGRAVAEDIRDTYGPAGLIIANHVLAHVESVADVLDGVQHLLMPEGQVYIEVQYLPDLLLNNAFDLVYHEHRNFFSLSSLEAAVERWGLYVQRVRLTNRQGGSLRVVLGHERPQGSRGYPPGYSPGAIRHREDWLHDISAYRGLQGRVDRIRDRLLDIIFERVEHEMIGYGAPAKATTLLNFCGIGDEVMPYVIDTTPAKQGRYIPGTGSLIIPPGSPKLLEAEYMLLLAWNYEETIVRNHLGWMEHGGRWIVPIPVPTVL